MREALEKRVKELESEVERINQVILEASVYVENIGKSEH